MLRKIIVDPLARSWERCANFPNSFTFDDVSQLDQDISTTLANVREWRNSFVRLNRVPLDILSIVPTYLSSQGDRVRASFVCRHWRRTFLQHAPLWSELFLSKGETYVKTLLERAKGSTLDIVTGSNDAVDIITLLPPHNQQFRYLNFVFSHWRDIQIFSEINAGPLPLLRTIIINAVNEFNLDGPDVMTPPSLPLFSNAVNLREFSLNSERSPFLGHFVFPNLTTFELSTAPGGEGFRASELLNFLEASPTLRTVQIAIIADIILSGIPQERVVVLPNVETFSLVVDDGRPGYKIAAHISCPSVRHTLLRHETVAGMGIIQDIFPTSVSWGAIVRQYTRVPAEEVALEIKYSQDPIIACSLIFRSPDATVISLDFKVSASDEDDPEVPFEDVFSQASRTIRDHPLLPNIKRLRIEYRFLMSPSLLTRIANEVGRLFQSVGPLDELTIYGCDLRSYLTPFLNLPERNNMEQPVVFPPIKKLAISHPFMQYYEEECMAAIVELAKSQHARGVPFEHVTVCVGKLPTAMREGLRPWVAAVDCYEELCMEDFE